MIRLIKKIIVLFFGSKRKIFTIIQGLNKGMKIFASPKTELSLISGSFELENQNLLKTLVKSGDTVFDIGANIGFFTLSFSKLTGSKGKVCAFEAIPETTKILNQNCKINNLKNVEIYNKAVSNKKENIEFLIPDNGKNHTMASMVWHKNDSLVKKINIESIVIDEDNYLNKLTPSLIKIDVEGAEGIVLKGIKTMLRKVKPNILIECSEIGREDTWKILKELNYQCYKSNDLAKEITEFNDYRHNDFLWKK